MRGGEEEWRNGGMEEAAGTGGEAGVSQASGSLGLSRLSADTRAEWVEKNARVCSCAASARGRSDASGARRAAERASNRVHLRRLTVTPAKSVGWNVGFNNAFHRLSACRRGNGQAHGTGPRLVRACRKKRSGGTPALALAVDVLCCAWSSATWERDVQ